MLIETGPSSERTVLQEHAIQGKHTIATAFIHERGPLPSTYLCRWNTRLWGWLRERLREQLRRGWLREREGNQTAVWLPSLSIQNVVCRDRAQGISHDLFVVSHLV